MDQYIVTGMTCAACQAHVEKAVSKVKGVDSVSVSLLTGSMGVEGTASPSEIVRAVDQAGYGARPLDQTSKASGQGSAAKLAAEEEALRDRTTPKLVRRLKLSLLFLVLLMYLTMGHNMLGWPLPAFLHQNYAGLALTQLLLAAAIMLINKDFYLSGFRSLFHGSPNMDTLVALGSSVSFGWSVYIFYQITCLLTAGLSAFTGSALGQGPSALPDAGTLSMDLMALYHNQLYFESAAMIPALITVGKMLESLSKGRTTDALKSLLKIAPKTATVERGGQAQAVGIDEVVIGDIFLVKPGEYIPVDGVVVEGSTAVDESALTGESIPVDKEAGNPISAATLNQSGFIKARATRVGQDTTFSQIVQMVSDAAATKAPIAKIADKVSGIFVPSVMAIAAAVLIGYLLTGHPVAFSIERAVTVLVISCPCALGLATPVAIMVGNGLGAKHGILFKTSEALEKTGRVQIVALDKTGTITAGKPEVTDIVPAPGCTASELLQRAYDLEVSSEHPLAKAIVQRAEADGLRPEPVSGFKALPGHGLTAHLQKGPAPGHAEWYTGNKGESGQSGPDMQKIPDEASYPSSGKTSAVLLGGSASYIGSLMAIPKDLAEASDRLAEGGKTPLFFAQDGHLLGLIAVADVIKADSAAAIRKLKDMGIETVMLTGDQEKTARAIGSQAGVDRIIAGVLPDGKEAVIRALQQKGRVAMVGDGINDAPALTRADIGIAIGAGADVAIESADVVLMNSKLTDVSAAIQLSRATIRNIHENLFWAFAYNALLIPMAAGLYPGIHLNPMWGAGAMALSSFTVCMNALRLNLVKIHDSSGNRKQGKSLAPWKSIEVQPARGQAKPAEATCSAQKAPAAQAQGGNGTEILLIEGMMCQNCERHVSEALLSVDGITEVHADHTTGKAVITYTHLPEEAKMKEAIEDADYGYLGLDTSSQKS